MEVLKKFAYNSTTSSLKQRNELFDELFKVLSDEKAICKSRFDEWLDWMFAGLSLSIVLFINNLSRTAWSIIQIAWETCLLFVSDLYWQKVEIKFDQVHWFAHQSEFWTDSQSDRSEFWNPFKIFNYHASQVSQRVDFASIQKINTWSQLFIFSWLFKPQYIVFMLLWNWYAQQHIDRLIQNKWQSNQFEFRSVQKLDVSLCKFCILRMQRSGRLQDEAVL